jgi:hypothetical protein
MVGLPLPRPGSVGREPASQVTPPTGGPRAGATLGPGAVRFVLAATPAAVDDVTHMPRPGGFVARLKGPAVGTTGSGGPARDSPSHGCGAREDGHPAPVLLSADEDGEPHLLDEWNPDGRGCGCGCGMHAEESEP